MRLAPCRANVPVYRKSGRIRLFQCVVHATRAPGARIDRITMAVDDLLISLAHADMLAVRLRG
jgi:hypothetical protein